MARTPYFLSTRRKFHKTDSKTSLTSNLLRPSAPKKNEPHRIRATLGGNLIHYPNDVGTPTADLLLIKVFLNSVISTNGAKFATADLSNFYLMTPLKRPEYGRVKITDIPDEIINEYKLNEKAIDGWVYFKVV